MDFLLMIIAAMIMFLIVTNYIKKLVFQNKDIRNFNYGYWMFFVDSQKVWWSNKNYRLLEVDRNEISVTNDFFLSMINPNHLEKFKDAISKKSYEVIVRVNNKNDRLMWVYTKGKTLKVPFTKKQIVVGFNRDISDLYDLTLEIKYLEHHDHITGTLNLEGFKQRLNELATIPADSVRHDAFLLMVELGLSHLQEGTNTLSLSKILSYVLNDLRTVFKSSDIARISEHKFAILTVNKSFDELSTYFKNLNQSLVNGVIIDDVTCYGNLQAFGFDLLPIEQYEQYFIYCDFVKRHFSDRSEDVITLINPELKSKCLESMHVRNEFMGGFKRNEVELYFQPIVNVRKNEISKLEALIRWNHSTKGILGPGAFLPFLDDSHDIKQVDYWVVTEAIRIISAYEAKGYRLPPISVNITGMTLTDELFSHYVKERLDAYKVRPENICIEVTEQLLITDMRIGNNNLNDLKEIGVQIVLDDFGTGYSSIQYVNNINAQVIKIDRSFIKDIHRNQKMQAIVRLIRNLAEDLAVDLVAEGIETPEELNFVLNNYCDYVQGYLISRPQPLDNILNLKTEYYNADYFTSEVSLVS